MPQPDSDFVSRLARIARGGVTATPLKGVELIKVTRPGELQPNIYKPLVSLIVRGEKRLIIGSEVLHYRAGDTYASAVDLPMRVEVLGCGPSHPYLAVNVTPDPAIIVDLAERTHADPSGCRGFAVHPAVADLMDTYRRLLYLLERPDEIEVMGPLLRRELHFRLMRGPQGAVLGKMAGAGERGAGIGAVVSLLRARYAEPIRTVELARAAGMSAPTLFRRFKAETGMSPLRYRTTIRLYEARRRLLISPHDVAAVAFAVGYASASQFSREYAREFGAPPMRDARRVRAKSVDAESWPSAADRDDRLSARSHLTP